MFGIKKEKGYTLINLVFILMIISFVASFLFKIADNNFMRRKLNIDMKTYTKLIIMRKYYKKLI